MEIYKSREEVYMAAFNINKKDAYKLVDAMDKSKKYKRIRIKKKYINRALKIMNKYKII